MTDGPDVPLLGAAEIRELAARHGIRPTKQWGQNFVVDGNTVRRIVRVAGVGAGRHRGRGGPRTGVADPGPAPRRRPGGGRGGRPGARRGAARDRGRCTRPHSPGRLEVVLADAMAVRELPGPPPTALVANLPYNVSVPVVLRFLELFPTLTHDPRHGPARGGRAAGRAARLAHLRRAERQGRLVRRRAPGRRCRAASSGRCRTSTRAGQADPARAPHDRRPPGRRCSPASTRRSPSGARPFGPRWPPGRARPALAEEALVAAGVDPRTRGEQLDVTAFAAIAAARAASRAERA